MPPLDQVPSLHSRPRGAAKADRELVIDDRFRATAAGLGRRIATRAVGVSLGLLDRLPVRAAQAGDGYDIWNNGRTGPCLDYASGHNCSPGCGPTPLCARNYCCRNGYHRRDGNIHSGWQLRPNQCWGRRYDGWLWRCSPSVRYRCHDGYEYVGPRYWATICRARA